MNYVRRDVLRLIAGVNACAIAGLGVVRAAPLLRFDTGNVAEALAAAQAQESVDIAIDAPVFAEAGSQVPIAVTASHPEVESISIVAARNAQPLAATLQITEPAVPFFNTQLHLEKSTDVFAVVRLRNSDKLLFAKTDVLVSSQDGCP